MNVSIWYDRVQDRLLFNRNGNTSHNAFAKIKVPDGSRFKKGESGDRYLLTPDDPNAVFKERKITALEVFMKASMNSEFQIVESEIHGMHTFAMYGAGK